MIRAAVLVFLLSLAGCCTQQGPVLRCASDFRAQRPFEIRVEGNSMVPVLRSGDRVRVEDKPFEEIQVGDLVVYWPAWSHTPVCHQAVRKVEGGWKVRGVDNGFEDPDSVVPGCYIGVATLSRRAGS